VKRHVEELGFSAHGTCYSLFEYNKLEVREVDNLIGKLNQPGTICVVVGGNTWFLSSAFGRLQGLRTAISTQVQRGDLMYVSFSAGSVMAGLTVEINMDNIQDVLSKGGTRKKDGFKLVPFAVRPHNQGAAQQAKGKAFQQQVAARQITDDGNNVLVDCPVLSLKDGEACLFAGAGQILLPSPDAKAEIAKLRAFLRFGSRSDAAWSQPARTLSPGVSVRELKASEMGSTHSKELHEFNFATGQYMRLLGTSAQPVKRVDVYESKPVQAAYEQRKGQFEARGLREEIWVFHGTKTAEAVRSICTGGFKVGGEPGGPPIANGAVHGNGVYSAKGPATPMGYGQGSHSVILCLALPGKKGAKGVDDSWYPHGDWVIFKSGAQLLPKYVVHF